MASNYPIVQITDSLGHVYYADTSNWSLPGTVATGATVETTQFAMPGGARPWAAHRRGDCQRDSVHQLSSDIQPDRGGAVNPNSGPLAGGTTVIITGTNFTGTTSVTFGGTAATSFNVNSPTQITAVDPAEAAGTVNVVVTNASGSSAISASDQFTYAAAPGANGDERRPPGWAMWPAALPSSSPGTNLRVPRP